MSDLHFSKVTDAQALIGKQTRLLFMHRQNPFVGLD